MKHFETLNAINVNDKTEKKEVQKGTKLTYLSWAWAWAEVKKVYPDATYTIYKNENGLPYVFDENTGYMVYTTVTIEDITHEMWLPVMDGKNKAMKSKPYKYTTRYGEQTVEQATMFDVNKTIMRCLTKNLAMFGLGLYIYAGEDLPEVEEEKKEKENPVSVIDNKMKFLKYLNEHNASDETKKKICAKYGVEKLEELTNENYIDFLEGLKKKGIKVDE